MTHTFFSQVGVVCTGQNTRVTKLPDIPASISYASIMDAIDMVQSVNENHLTTFTDLAVLSDSETSSSTSWKRILGIEQCDHRLRPV